MNITVIGTGNVADHLVSLIGNSKHTLYQVCGRNKERAALLSGRALHSFRSEPATLRTDADLYILAVSDDAVSSVAEQMPDVSGIVVHTSGSVKVDALNKFNSYGVWYPLQTFSRDQQIDFKDVPVCVEGSDSETTKTISGVFENEVNKVEEVSSEQRAVVHLSAVFACNFSNHMYHLALKLLSDKGLEFSLLHSLIDETVKKALRNPPNKVQTGPAVRNDHGTLQKHSAMLSEDPELAEIYRLLTAGIQKNNQ